MEQWRALDAKMTIGVSYVKEVDNNKELYEKYAKEPLFKENKIKEEFKPQAVLDFFIKTIIPSI